MNRRAALFAVVATATAILLLMPELASAQNEIAQGGRRAHRWAVIGVRGFMSCVLLAGFLLWSVGRYHWAGGLTMVAGGLGAIYSDRIADEIFG